MEITVREICALAAFGAGIIFGAAGIAGLFRFSDPYARLQAGSLCGTTAVLSIFIGALFLAPNAAVAARIIIITLFFLLSAPTGSHIVARFAWNSGIKPKKPAARKTAASKTAPDMAKNADHSAQAHHAEQKKDAAAEKEAVKETFKTVKNRKKEQLKKKGKNTQNNPQNNRGEADE